MLRETLGHFLDSLTEREFDGPLLALLAARGFSDIHFTHGAFEFGKDVIAKGISEGSVIQHQYAIQSKAGDIGLSEWREIRPQIEEALENTLSHPSFNTALPRIAILVTTGRLKGGAILDAQQVAQRAERNGRAFETWDKDQILDWLTSHPDLGISGPTGDFLVLLGAIHNGSVTEPQLEKYARRWLPSSLDEGEPRVQRARAAVEAAVIGNRLRNQRRLDLAAYTALNLYRAGWAWSLKLDENEAERPELASSALRLFAGYVEELLDLTAPLLQDSRELLKRVFEPFSIMTYPVVCLRLAELFGIHALLADQGLVSGPFGDRATRAVVQLVSSHPGCARPVSDQFAVSLIPAVMVTHKVDPALARRFVGKVCQWLISAHNPEVSGLGLAGLDETEDITAERLFGGALSGTTLSRRQSSYLATVLIDVCDLIGAMDLLEAFRANLEILRVVPSITVAVEAESFWRRGGGRVFPQPRVEYQLGAGNRMSTDHYNRGAAANVPAVDSIVLASVVRSRHYPSDMQQIIA